MFIPKRFPRLLTVIILSALIFALAISGVNASAAGDKVFNIIEITNFYGMLEDANGDPVAAVMAKNIKDIVNGNSHRTLIVSGGDNYLGSILSNMLQGAPVMSAFNSIGVAVSTLGNHEFDWGLDTVTRNVVADYPHICSNLFYKGTNNRVFDPYKIFEKDGVKIAVVGAITEELPDLVRADYVEDYEVRSIIDNVGEAAEDARANGCRIVIALLHEGDNLDGKTGVVFDVADQLGGPGGVVDAVLGGHTHNLVNTVAANYTPVAVAETHGKGFIDMQITMSADGALDFNTRYIACDTDSTVFPYGYKAAAPAVDQAVQDIVAAAKREVDSIAREKFGTTDTGLTITQADSPWGESQAGNWVCDVVKELVNADFAFTNNGALRVDIPKGDITMRALHTFLPFESTVMTAEMTGAQIKTLLEQAVCDGGKGIQVAGLMFTYDPGAPSGNRVMSINKADGTIVGMADTSKTYKVATNDFLAGGGDGFAVFKTAKFINTHIMCREVLAENIRQASPVSARMQGRIKSVQNTGAVEPVTRAEFAGLLVRAVGYIEDEYAASFTDVLPGQLHAGVVGAAFKAGLINGYEDGTFRPGDPVTREEMVVMAARAVKALGFTAEVSDVDAALAKFNDRRLISEWAKEAVAAATEAGMINGSELGDFSPFDHATRAEATLMVTRTLNYMRF